MNTVGELDSLLVENPLYSEGMFHHEYWTIATNLYKKAVDYFCIVADASNNFPPLKNEKWDDYCLTASKWKLIKLIHNCLKVNHC